MEKIRDLEPVEIEKLNYVLNAETKQYRLGYFACVAGAITMAGLALYELLGFGNQGTEVLQILLGLLALLMAGIAYLFRARARSAEFRFGPVCALSGAFSREFLGSPRYSYPAYYLSGERVYIPPIWDAEARFADRSSITVHFTEVSDVADGAVTNRRKFVVEIPGFNALKAQGWLK